MKYPISFVSSSALESWDWTTPWTTGIGGSETSHIEMVSRLHKRGLNVFSYAPTFHKDQSLVGPSGIPWFHCDLPVPQDKGITIFYRNPDRLDKVKSKSEIWWFVAQDLDYGPDLTPERLEKIDRYITLCSEHSAYTLRKYPSLKGKVYQSSNGIRSALIQQKMTNSQFVRDPNRLFYPSSPDRGLKLLLEQWWRIREFNPQATLNIAYGFNNMETIVRLMNGNDWRLEYQKELEELINQPGITFLGRVNQDEVYNQWLQTGIWPYPNDFCETSCVTAMEAQALGAFPVTNDLWAVGENVQHGFMVQGVPQKSELIKHLWLSQLKTAFEFQDGIDREEMMEWALDRFDWERVVDQWENWIKEDFKRIRKCSIKSK